MRIVGFDLETTGLNAIMGRILCASFIDIKEKGKVGKVKTFRCDHKDFKNPDNPLDDSKLALAIKGELGKAHMIVGWNSKLFDVPLLNSRLSLADIPPYSPHLHLDLMYYTRGASQRIGSSKMVNAEKFYGIKNAKTEIDWDVWKLAAGGWGNKSREALSEVAHHCEQDVRVLSELYWHLIPFVRNIHR